MDSKPFYASKTLWVNTIAILGIMLQSQTGEVMDAETQVGLLGLVNLILRVVTNTSLTSA